MEMTLKDWVGGLGGCVSCAGLPPPSPSPQAWNTEGYGDGYGEKTQGERVEAGQS